MHSISEEERTRILEQIGEDVQRLREHASITREVSVDQLPMIREYTGYSERLLEKIHFWIVFWSGLSVFSVLASCIYFSIKTESPIPAIVAVVVLLLAALFASVAAKKR